MEREELDHFRPVTVLQDWCQASHLAFNVAKEKSKRQPVTHPPFTPNNQPVEEVELFFLFLFEPNY